MEKFVHEPFIHILPILPLPLPLVPPIQAPLLGGTSGGGGSTGTACALGRGKVVPQLIKQLGKS